jgi:hypothetical protein
MSATLLGGYYAMLACPKSIKTRGLCGLLRKGTRPCMCYLVVLLHFGDNQCGTPQNMPHTTVDECHPTRRLLRHACMPQIYQNPRTLWPSAQRYQTMHVVGPAPVQQRSRQTQRQYQPQHSVPQPRVTAARHTRHITGTTPWKLVQLHQLP